MPQRKHKPEEIVAKLRQVDVLLSQGRPVADAIRAISVTPFTYYRWRREFGGLKSDQVKRLKDFEKENERLRKAVSDLTLEKLILREAASGTSEPDAGRGTLGAFAGVVLRHRAARIATRVMRERRSTVPVARCDRRRRHQPRRHTVGG